MNDIPEQPPNTETRENLILRFYHSPWFSFSAWLVGIVGILFALYSHYSNIRYPELVYFVSPARAIVVSQGSASRLAVTFDGQPIGKDVTAAQIVVWNRGKEPVSREAVRQPFVISTENQAPILEATIRKKSRSVVQLDLDETRLASGKLGLRWNMLETGDGGVLQVVYAGDTAVPIKCTGVLIGQPEIRELEYRAVSRMYGRNKSWLIALGVTGVLGLLLSIAPSTKKSKVSSNRELASLLRFSRLLFSILSVALIVMVIYALAFLMPPDPPFGLDWP
jgi:hypothetical protein